MVDKLCFTGSFLLFLLMAVASVCIPDEKWRKRVAYVVIALGIIIGIISIVFTTKV